MKIVGQNGVELPSSSAFKNYVEGTFTPTVIAVSGSGSASSYTTQYGKYTRIGNVVFFQIRVTLSNKGTLSGGYIGVGNLPFTSAAYTGRMTVNVGDAANVSTVTDLRNTVGTYIPPSSAYIMIANEAGNAVSTSNLANNSSFDITGVYFV